MSQPCIPAGHRLFCLTVRKEWVAEAEVLIAAPTIERAKSLACRRVKLDSYDAKSDGAEVESVAEVPLATIKAWDDADIAPDVDAIAYIDQPPGSPSAEKIDAEELIRLLVSDADDRLEQLRIAAIEHNNGQIPLPLSSDVTP